MKIVQYVHSSELGDQKRLGILINETQVLDPNLTYALHFEKEGHFNPFDRANYVCPSSLHALLRNTGNAREVLDLANVLGRKFIADGSFTFKNGRHIIIELSEKVRLDRKSVV